MCVYQLGFALVLGNKNHANYSYSLLLQQKVKKKNKKKKTLCIIVWDWLNNWVSPLPNYLGNNCLETTSDMAQMFCPNINLFENTLEMRFIHTMTWMESP